ncbi:flagellar biosynthesis protein FlhF [Methylomicrobium agile]|uniref:flagellar biosynthesis protein FlhF n=1 Tax=Methylomicrobium agile TaxID=39774 RepID=UPI0004DEE78B|nr:flagellar biosynthesis protein FlhF [Methylomicrobium agile]
MKIKRFFAPDIRQAMRMVKEELGADAVIMSNKSVDGGIEIVAARDFDEQLIQNKLVEQSGEPLPTALNRAAPRQAPGLQAETNRFDGLSNNEKRSRGGMMPDHTPRAAADQFVGYAERMQFRAQENVLPVKETKPAPSAVVHPFEKEKPVEKAKTAETKQPTLSEKLLLEMFKDLKSLKSAIDSKMADTGITSLPQANPARAHLLQQLAKMGISKKTSVNVANQLNSYANIDLAFAEAQELMAKMLPIAQDNLLDTGGVVALIGPTGVGKTTTIAKLAAKFILKHGPSQVALITTDNYRIGAHEQINTYGRILGVPVRVASNSEELRNLILGLSDKRLILIDTAGMSQRDMKLVEQINMLRQSVFSIKAYLVMSAASEYRVMNEIINAFRFFEPQACILTKLDEAVTAGPAFSALIEQNLPVSFITNGQRVPEDMFIPVARTLIGQCAAESKADNSVGDFENYEMFVA